MGVEFDERLTSGWNTSYPFEYSRFDRDVLVSSAIDASAVVVSNCSGLTFS
jgi:hypothetical protein